MISLALFWLRERDLNPRPSGYEPDELPDCSIPRQRMQTLTETLPKVNRYFYICCVVVHDSVEPSSAIHLFCKADKLIQATIDLPKALVLRRQGTTLIDVRTPAEFAEATIPGAVNVPIFSDAERARIGTLYKQEGKRVARKVGIELVAPKIPQLLEQVEAAQQERREPVILFCWRGGMRSLAMTSFCNLAGIAARQLLGGHKAFRRHVCSYFEQQAWPPIYVLRGLTGVGKTRVLQELQKKNYPTVDLEGLANHRGSAFGALGLPPQPAQKMFEALLWDRLDELKGADCLVTEGESLHIEVRNQFERPIQALKERLGKQVVAELLQLLEAGDWHALVRELMVRYYDPLYLHTLPEQRLEIELEPFASGLQRVEQALASLQAKSPL